MDKVLPRIQRIHNPPLPGTPLLLLPERILVRWPLRAPMPVIGEPFSGTAVSVPPHLRQVVMDLLFSPNALERCDAAKRLAEDQVSRRRVLYQIYSRPYVQQLLASATRIEPELREQIEAAGGVPIRRLTRAAYAPTLARQRGRVRL